MQSDWKVTKNIINDKPMYAVYRLKDIAAVDHSGNREHATGYMDDRQEALDIAEKLNKEEKEQVNE